MTPLQSSSTFSSPRSPTKRASRRNVCDLPQRISTPMGEVSPVEFLGIGSFGEVWRGANDFHDADVALKFVQKERRNLAVMEINILMHLAENSVEQGFPIIYSHCTTPMYFCIAMERLGTTLIDHMRAFGRSGFSLQTTVLLGEQMINRMEYIHSKGILHRDIKPDNFMFGVGNKIHHLYLIDFGLSTTYWCQGNDGKAKHIAYKDKCTVGGTARYISLNTHNGIVTSRRDDLESIVYLILHMFKGVLPWSKLDVRDRDYTANVAHLKRTVSPSKLCEGTPPEFEQLISYVRKLEFSDRPDYEKMWQLVHSCRLPTTQDYDLPWLEAERGLTWKIDKLETLEARKEVGQPDDNVAKPRRSSSKSSRSVVPRGLLSFFKSQLKCMSARKSVTEVREFS